MAARTVAAPAVIVHGGAGDYNVPGSIAKSIVGRCEKAAREAYRALVEGKSALDAVIVHGGAYAIPDRVAKDKVKGCERAAREAHRALVEGKSALDAAEVAVRHLEDDPVFNAGHGSVLNFKGEIEMDAFIMDGKDLRCGAVAGVHNISNPVSLARMVMEKTQHVLLAGKGADDFAREEGVPEVSTEELCSEEMRKSWEVSETYKGVVDDEMNNPLRVDQPKETGHETVGAVAFDVQGNLAAATSTGGITLKRAGRIGDSPLVGSGGYCNNLFGGISTTGHGESIARVVLAQRALSLVEFCGLSPQKALEQALDYMKKNTGGRGGMIMIGKNGEIAKSFTTLRMVWASVNQEGVLESGLDEPQLKL